MADLPPALEGFASLLAAQPQPVREIFQYCLCLMMVESGKMRLAYTVPGDSSSICIFETVAGDTFSVPHPPLNQQEENAVLDALKDILKDEGEL